MKQSKTHGGKRAVTFQWELAKNKIVFETQKDKAFSYSFEDIQAATAWLHGRFGLEPFPLANNVEKLHKKTEKDGFGVALYTLKPDTTFAQRSSYLGVVLEELGIFKRVLTASRIQWRLNPEVVTPVNKVLSILKSE